MEDVTNKMLNPVNTIVQILFFFSINLHSIPHEDTAYRFLDMSVNLSNRIN